MLALVVLIFATVHALPSSRIINGEDAEEDEFPHQVSLQFSNNFHFCGGSLIDPEWVLTAAHCVEGMATNSFHVVVGEHDFSKDDGQKIYRVAKITMHQNYDDGSATFANDIALVKLSSKAPQENVIPLASSGNFAGDRCIISGWGYTVHGVSSPDILQKASVSVMSDRDCRRVYGNSVQYRNHICINGGSGACNGDSGGPLLCSGVLAGVTSWGINGCPVTYPSVYVRVTEYVDWIQKNMV